MIDCVIVLVKSFYRRDVRLLALCPRGDCPGLFNCARSLLQFRRRWRYPEGMVISHGDAPVTHSALRIHCRNFRERLFRFLVFKRMEPSDCAIELFLSLRLTGSLEINDSEFF